MEILLKSGAVLMLIALALAWLLVAVIYLGLFGGFFTNCPFYAMPPRNGSEAAAAMDEALEQAIHLALLNRGVMITPFHNMMLVCPDTSDADIDRLLAAFDEVLGLLAG